MSRHHPGFTAIAVLTLALGAGSTTAIFSVVKAVLLNQLPYRNPDRVVALAQGQVGGWTVNEWRARSRSFESISEYADGHRILAENGEAECDPHIAGRILQLSGEAYRVIGVLPPDFHPLRMSNPAEKPAICMPLGYDPAEASLCRSCLEGRAIARLKRELGTVMQ
jgi:hypothetical protein